MASLTARNKSKLAANISVVIPTLNEADNVKELVKRLDRTLLRARKYELIFVDDASTDSTIETLSKLQASYPIVISPKAGKPGKAYSLIQGFKLAKYDMIAMIDADLQYPPEAIAPMAEMIENNEADIIVADRTVKDTSVFRRFVSRSCRFTLSKVIWKIDADVQSGLKVFRKEITDRVQLQPKGGWAFDLEFLAAAHSGGYAIANYPVSFERRSAGATKINLLSASSEILLAGLRLRLRAPHFIPFHDTMHKKLGHGFHYKGEQYVTHTSLAKSQTAIERTSELQRIMLALALAIITLAFIANWYVSLIALISIVTVFYFADLIFNLYLITRSFYRDNEIKISKRAINKNSVWPLYTIFCPLYKEAQIVPQFIDAMTGMDYPKNKLEVMLLLEEDDAETINEIRSMQLPDYFKVIVVPHSLPKTKPKACNYGLQYATGEFAVIYDAEDVPEPLQLKKAVLAFRRARKNIGCIQAKLNYYNWNQNILTRLFTLEYSLWFNLVLTGLQSINSPIPLGGTSNHFRTADLKHFAGWDAFNVTEDADLGMRIAKSGMQTAILDSVTLEEANSEFKNWLKQRSRWIKGYMQTYLIHMRDPRQFTVHKLTHLFVFQLVVGGKVLSMLINPLLWMMTLTYFVIGGAVAEFIQSLYLTPIFYLGTIALVFGNFLYMYYYMMGAAKQQRPELIIYALLIPFYWLMMSVAAIYAIRDLIIRPHHWHKTKHGLHLKRQSTSQETELAAEAI